MFGNELNVDNPVVMGILNATPDSFYNKGRDSGLNDLLHRAEKMQSEGAAILDIGGMSSRPNATIISVQEEVDRVIPIIEILKQQMPSMPLSIDTFRSEVALACLEAGASIINDISAGQIDAGIIEVAARYRSPYICMHMQGTPQTMQQAPHYENVVNELISFFEERINTLEKAGVKQVILDPGFGFGKTLTHNYQLLANLDRFLCLQKPILVGISRKSMVYKPLNLTADDALNGTSALHMIALQNGAKILRVHDVKEAKECILLHEFIKENRKKDV